MRRLCSETKHARSPLSIRPFGKSWRAECGKCGVPLVRTEPKVWRELREPSSEIVQRIAAGPAPAVAAAAPAPDDTVLRLTAMICKIEMENGDSSLMYDRAYVLGVYFDVVDAMARRASLASSGARHQLMSQVPSSDDYPPPNTFEAN